MIERFNFFDIYAYLLPGTALGGLVWLPFAIVSGSWPASDVSSALLLLVAAYIVGHILYHPAKEALPSESKGKYHPPPVASSYLANRRHPSEFLLDVGESTFPKEFKEGLQNLINRRFGNQAPGVQVNIHFDWDKLDQVGRSAESKQRELAFSLCRAALVTGKAASYGEQFQGLYELTRCLAVVFALGCAYHLGWALAVLKAAPPHHVAPEAVFGGIAIVAAAVLASWGDKMIEQRQRKAQTLIGLLMLALFLCPFVLRSSLDPAKPIGAHKPLLLVALALVDLFAISRFYAAYRPFAFEFAKATYRDIYVYATKHDTQAGDDE